MRVIDLDLADVLDDEQPLVRRDLGEESRQEGRLLHLVRMTHL